MPRSQVRTPPARAVTPSAALTKPRKRRRIRTATEAKADHRGGEWGRGVAERLRVLKGAEGVRPFAERVGIAYSAVSAYLKGRRLPDAETLRKVAERTGASLDWLLLGDGGDAPRFRGQSRNELADDVASYPCRQIVARIRGTDAPLGQTPPGAFVEVNGSRVLAALVEDLSARVIRDAQQRRDWDRRMNTLVPVQSLLFAVESVAEERARGTPAGSRAWQDAEVLPAASWRIHDAMQGSVPAPQVGDATFVGSWFRRDDGAHTVSTAAISEVLRRVLDPNRTTVAPPYGRALSQSAIEAA